MAGLRNDLILFYGRERFLDSNEGKATDHVDKVLVYILNEAHCDRWDLDNRADATILRHAV
jgi:hypothetical protein